MVSLMWGTLGSSVFTTASTTLCICENSKVGSFRIKEPTILRHRRRSSKAFAFIVSNVSVLITSGMLAAEIWKMAVLAPRLTKAMTGCGSVAYMNSVRSTSAALMYVSHVWNPWLSSSIDDRVRAMEPVDSVCSPSAFVWWRESSNSASDNRMVRLRAVDLRTRGESVCGWSHPIIPRTMDARAIIWGPLFSGELDVGTTTGRFVNGPSYADQHIVLQKASQ